MGIVQSRTGESDGGVREVFIGGIKGGTPLQSCQPSLGMGSLGGPHARSGSVRGAPRQPMPDAMELERRFTKVLVSQTLAICMLLLFFSDPLRGPRFRIERVSGELDSIASNESFCDEIVELSIPMLVFFSFSESIPTPPFVNLGILSSVYRISVQLLKKSN